MLKLVASLAAGAALFFASAVSATEVENADQKDHQVTIAVGDGGPSTVTLKPGEKKFLCPEGCSMMLNDGEWEVSSTFRDKVIIKDGKLQIQPRS